MTDNRIMRKCYLKENQVPTISVMRKHMKPALADIYFKSMDQKRKEIAGLEPSLTGGGVYWYVPPKDLLQGRSVMKPLNAKYLTQLNWSVLEEIAARITAAYYDFTESQTRQEIHDIEEQWKLTVPGECQKHWDYCVAKETKAVTECIINTFSDFRVLYTTSLVKIERLLADAAVKTIEETRYKVLHMMEMRYKNLVQMQAARLSYQYDKKLSEEKEKLKRNFVLDLETTRSLFYDEIHNINLEKHVAIEKVRHLLECQKTACQVYVALKERQECFKEMELAKHKQSKENAIVTEKVETKELQIRHAEQQEKRQNVYIRSWQIKVSHVMKNFQMFISYCLKMLPKQADFFINMEKLMLIQLSESLEDPSSDSIFQPDFQQVQTPVLYPHHFYLFCEKNNEPFIHEELCQKHYAPSASQFPVIVINKRCIYNTNCVNFEQFANKIKGYVDDNILNDAIFNNYNYDIAIPVKYSASKKFEELKLETSIMQVLKQEIANIQNLSFECSVSQIPHCYECNRSVPQSSKPLQSQTKSKSLSSLQSITPACLTQIEELAYTQGSPHWDSYLKYVLPKKCDCSKMAKKHLLERLPAYMLAKSYYNVPKLLNYKPCSALELEIFVEISKRENNTRSLSKQPTEPNTKEVACQYTDLEYDCLCSCFSNDSVASILTCALTCNTRSDRPFEIVNGFLSSTHLLQSKQSFVKARLLSLSRLMESYGIQEIFEKNDCNFNV